MIFKKAVGSREFGRNQANQTARKRANSFLQIFLLISPLVFSQCIRFKVENLTPSLLLQLPIGDTIDSVQAIHSNNVLTNIPIITPISRDFVFIPDYQQSIIKIFNYKGDLKKIIGILPKNELDIETINVKFNSIGQIQPGYDDDLFIENKNTAKSAEDDFSDNKNPSEVFSGNFTPEKLSDSHSVIMHVNLENGSTRILGEEGLSTNPFEHIEKMFLLQDNMLGILYYKTGKIHFKIYQNLVPLLGLNETSVKSLLNGDDNLESRLESITPHPSGKFSFFSYQYNDTKYSKFKFRRIFKYDHKTAQAVIIKEIQDSSEILYSILENGDFYIWETESGSLSARLQVHDSTGYHYNNKRMLFSAPRTQWRETFTDYESNLYTLKLRSGALELYKWN